MTSRIRAFAAATGTMAALAALPGPAALANSPQDADAYRFADDAKAVHGAASSSDGPRLKPGGSYRDTIKPGQQLYYSVVLDDKSNYYLAAVAAPPNRSQVTGQDGISVKLSAADGTECSSHDETFGSDKSARPLSALGWREIAEGGECQGADTYNLLVTRTSNPTSDPSAWPVELHLMQEPGVKKAGATEAPDRDTLPSTPPDAPTGTPKKITGGTGFSDAAGMYQGVWKDRIRPGATHFYRVPLDFGQQLYTKAEFGTVPGVEGSGSEYEGVRVQYFNPARGEMRDDTQPYDGKEQAAVQSFTPPVAYRNRYSTDGWQGWASVAGWYYVSVSVSPEVSGFVKSGTVPVTLRTTVKGEPHGAPAYDGDAVKAGFGVTGKDRDAAAKGQTAAQVEDSDNKMTIAWIGIGAGLVLLLGLGGWTLIARRRAASAPAGPPMPPAGGYGPPPGGPQHR